MEVNRYPGSNNILCPMALKQSLDQMGFPTPFWGLANSIHCPVGMNPGSAWFLTTRAAGQAAQKNSFQGLVWTDGTRRTIFQNYVLHRAVLVGPNGDSKAPYLLEFRDKRQVLRMSAIDQEYNVRRSNRFGDTGVGDMYYTDSRNSGSDWTWQTMFENVWSRLPSAIRGTAPTLPYTPVSEPENFRFHGSAWEAIAEILQATHSVLCLNPITDVFTVQRLSTAQSGLSSALDALTAAKRLIHFDGPLTDLNLSVMPASIGFLFPKRMALEALLVETTTGGVLVDPYHTITKTTGISGAQAGTILPYRTRFIAELDADGSTINNASALDSLADELRDEIVGRINFGTERGSYIYSGIVTSATPGCEINEVIWRDYGDEMGCVTELIKNPALGYPEDAPLIPPLQPFTGEILVQNDSGGDYAATSGPHTFLVCAGTPGSEAGVGQYISAYNKSSQAFKNTKFGTATKMHGNWYASPQQV